MTTRTGRHFLHIPGPSPVPERVLRAMDMPVIDHRGPDFAGLGKAVLEGAQAIFQTRSPVIIYPGSGTGAWESAIVNTLSAGDRVLMFETGHFATLWRQMAARWGIEVEFVPGDWRRGVDPAQVEAILAEDRAKSIKAVMVVHNETSTGATSRIAEIRKAIDRANHTALFLVDTISGLGSAEYAHDEWGVDVAVSCSQKGLMLPPGLGLVALSDKALAAAKTATLPRSYWDWEDMLKPNTGGYFPYTPATNLLYGLREAIAMLREEGLAEVFARHQRLAAATRAAVEGWGLEVLCREPSEYSPVLTAVVMPEGHDADALRTLILEKYDLSLGTGLAKMAGKIFRIGHLGECNDLMLMAALSGVEMGLKAGGVPHARGGVLAAMDALRSGIDD
ncbi:MULTISPECIES: aminotransferase class V-fold PLP-dependent enzyme [Methylobacterium]|uniref:Serine--glyoxylate aminotransferase n=1 Tax=Methylobacterium bullatum TaxID=570505 RepID=A0AAV4Z8K6_9HYPH|nr:MULTISPECIES: aminotransferase class V-fold PLP-dependent enzyme [Methylobacterium]MBD8903211.1 serine--glyoxylate aminotransferase [Methylobacterium bullatum]TXN27881.1 aminotransferase class V-fold PLP-dependent enzyme [Methylobacterium sp. WL19]GJD40383.1 Serine--glyoxylate aminotransferase [Methylobacterium bullatum]